jgi:signal transduction histidine kinase/DNA-binding response OmpR family regulator
MAAMTQTPSLSKRSLSKQLLIGFGVSLIAVGLGTLRVTYTSLRRDLAQQVQQRAVAITQGLEFATEGAIEVKETTLLGRIVQNYATLPTVVEIAIVDPQGMVLAHSQGVDRPTRYVDMRPTLAAPVKQAAQGGIDVHRRTFFNGKPVVVEVLPFSSALFGYSGGRGVAIAVLDLDQLERETWRNFRSSVLTMAAGTGIMLLFLLWLIRRLVLRPLAQLNQAVRHSEQLEGFSLPTLPPNEIGFLGATFDSVLGQLRTYKQLELEIAERKQAEVAQRYELATRAARVWVWDWDPQTDEFLIDQGLRDFLGYGEVDVPHHYETWVGYIGLDDRPLFQATLQAHLEGQTPEFSCEYRLLKVDGTHHWFLSQGKAVRDAKGIAVRAIGTITDIAERKQVELMLREAKESADAASRAKSTFLASMSHELRTPLNAILGFTQLMFHDTNLSSEQQEHLQLVFRSGDHLLSLINDVLDMARIEAGRILLEVNSFNLYLLLESVVQMLKIKVGSQAIQVELDCGSDLPECIYADEKKLRQVLINLVGNAVKFTVQGSVSLWVRATVDPVVPDHCQLNFEVRDTGIGVTADERHKLFVPFGQAEAGKKRSEGTGLGLAISQKLVQLMGGHISFESQFGVGSTFKFAIGVQVAENAPREITEPALRVIGLVADQPKYRLLVVDDRDTNRYLLIKLLTAVGFEVREAENGQDAIAAWKSWQPHLIWMDMQMPILNGYDATKQIRQAQSDRGLACKIIAVSASVLDEDRDTMIAAGCDDFVRKPYREAIIFDKIAEHLSVKYVYSGSPTPSETLPTKPALPAHPVKPSLPLSPLRILVVEDTPVNQKIVLNVLKNLGYQADIAQDGVEAVEAFQHQEYDLIFMDLQMPRMNGVEATIQIRSLEQASNGDKPSPSHVEIVAMTANNSDDDRNACFAAGMNDFVAKPFKLERLGVILNRLAVQKAS